MKFPKACARPKTGVMNATEKRYHDLLMIRKAAGEVIGIWYEPFSLRLAPNTYYRPDFLVQLADGSLELHEVKGFWTDDAKAKTKIAADLYPWPIYCATCKGKRFDVALIHDHWRAA
jgi:hypothetical protein